MYGELIRLLCIMATEMSSFPMRHGSEMLNAPQLSSDFLRFLLEHNRPHLNGFRNWIFQPEMLFQSRKTWWGEEKARPSPHEGLDLCTFEDAQGRVGRLDAHTRIPAPFAGIVVRIDRDFLGKSIFLAHDVFCPDGRQLVGAYGHTAPVAGVLPGTKVAAGEIIAALSGGSRKKTSAPVHLHITFAWIPPPLDPQQLTWNNLGRDAKTTLLDPLPILSPVP